MKLFFLAISLFFLSACGQDTPGPPPTPDDTDSVTARAKANKSLPPAPYLATDAVEGQGAAMQPGAPNGATASDQEAKGTTPTASPQDNNTHSAMNSLDYFGAYLADERPAGNPSGIARLSLHEDGSCLLVMQDGKKRSGTYKWDATGSIIHIGEEKSPDLLFFVGEGFLILGSTTPTGEGQRFTQQPANAAAQ